MIERMKKITLLVSEKEKENFLFKLKETGVLHVHHVQPPIHHEINYLEDRLTKVDRVIDILAQYIVKDTEKKQSNFCERDFMAETDKIETMYRAKQDLEVCIQDFDKKLQWFDPWGMFNPEDIRKLRKKGIEIRLYRVRKEDFNKTKDTIKENYHVLKEDKGNLYVAIVSTNDIVEREAIFEELALPEMLPEQMQTERKKAKNKIEEIESFLKETALSIDSIKERKKGLEEEKTFAIVKCGMQEEEKFSYLQGFCPEKTVSKITSIAKQHGLGYLIEEPDNPDETPTYITNPKWIKIIDPIFQFMNTLPGYSEFDISFPFLVFFSLFFAMLIGDGGYGLLFLIITILARRKLKQLPREPFILMYILSLGTIIWGAITGTWFGVEQIAQAIPFKFFIVEGINSFADNTQNLLIYVCFLIGVIHLTIAHLFRGIRVINSLKVLAEAGWIMILWGMFFLAGKFVIDNEFPAFMGGVLVAGMVLVLLFANPEKGMIKGALGTLSELPLSVIGAFSDIVSYLRLFAVGYASVVVAQSFNEMALGSGINNVMAGISAALILFLGHTLNIVLGFMAVVVHGIRLNMLEFSGHIGMQWSGKKYEPFN